MSADPYFPSESTDDRIANAVIDLLQICGITSWDSVITALVTLFKTVKENEERPRNVDTGFHSRRYTDQPQRRSAATTLGNIHPDFFGIYGPHHVGGHVDRWPANGSAHQCPGGHFQPPCRQHPSQQNLCGNGRGCLTPRRRPQGRGQTTSIMLPCRVRS